ncbi:MAG TPA: DUF6286 domain-containing protein [Pseudonocardia sp.]|nr:DUF6286 domain-containing protein [Pseudonocardia sp.]
MRVLIRVLSPLLGLALAAAGVLLVIEVVAAWVRPDTTGLLVPWLSWRAALAALTWADPLVTWVAVGVAVLGLLLVLLGLLARRRDVPLEGTADGMTVTTSPRVLARLVGRRVRSTDDVAGASVTASRRAVRVSAQSWGEPSDGVRSAVRDRVDTLLDELPLARRPRVAVSVHGRKGPQ